MLGGGIFTISSAASKDIQTLIICRFFSGLFGASQLSVVPSVLADLYNNTDRGIAMTLYSLAVFVGPFSAPFVGGFIATSSLGWRWTLYIPAFMAFLGTSLDLFLLRETYAPHLLLKKAAEIRRQSHNWGIHARQEEVELNFHKLIRSNFSRPLHMLVTEPIVFLISLYMSYIYGIVYSLLEAYPYVFEGIHGMSPGVGGLTSIGLIVGQLLACALLLSRHSTYTRRLAATHNKIIPEWRLAPAIVGAPAFTAGIFWKVHRASSLTGYIY
jgi:MFS transporter, DHA1 family, multidrug resistance protein